MKFHIVQLIIGIAILVILFLSFDFQWETLRSVDFLTWNFFIILILLPAGLLPRSYRWKILMNDGDQEHKVSHWESFKFMLVGLALNLVLPAGAGEVAKSYFGYKWTGIKERMLSISLYDKVMGIAALGFLALLIFIHTGQWIFILVLLLSLGPLVVLVYFHQFQKIRFLNTLILWVDSKIKKFSIVEMVNHFSFSKKTISLAYSLSILGAFLDYVLLYFCFRLLASGVSLGSALINGPILTLGRLFPFTLSGLGSDEALMVFIFSDESNGILGSNILISALIYRIVMIVLPALVGLYYLFVMKSWKKQIS